MGLAARLTFLKGCSGCWGFRNPFLNCCQSSSPVFLWKHACSVCQGDDMWWQELAGMRLTVTMTEQRKELRPQKLQQQQQNLWIKKPQCRPQPDWQVKRLAEAPQRWNMEQSRKRNQKRTLNVMVFSTAKSPQNNFWLQCWYCLLHVFSDSTRYPSH